MTEDRKRVCVVTGSRAEYGLLYWTMKSIQALPGLELKTVVTGTHLSEEFGRTEKFIEADGFVIDERVDCLPTNDSALAVGIALGGAVAGFSESFARLNPDIILVLGDRYEIFAAATAAMILRIPVAHIHGGEITAGAIDDAIRHSISKIAHIHFVAADEYRNRLVQMGESPESIHVVGAVGLEWIHSQNLPSQDVVSQYVGLPFGARNIILAFHPETLREDGGTELLEELLAALREISANVYCSGSNADSQGRRISAMIQDFAREKPESRVFFESLGHRRFLALLKCSDMIVGNSSSGILEAPALGTMTLNLGSRQEGRLRADSITDMPICATRREIRDCIAGLLACPITPKKVPYGDGVGASAYIANVLDDLDFERLLHKRFHDI